MKKVVYLSFVSAVLLLSACGGAEQKDTNSAPEEVETEQVEIVEAPAVVEAAAEYDLNGIASLAKKKSLSSEEQDFVLDQYEIFCRETKGMDKNAKKEYLKNKGADGKIIMLVVMGAENSKSFTDAQKARLNEIQEKYK